MKAAAGAHKTTGLILSCLIAAVSGCSARSAPHIDPGMPQISGRPSAMSLDRSLDARRAALAHFRGQARLSYQSGNESGKVSQMIVVNEPNRVRIDFMSPFGPTYTVASDGSRLLAYDRGEKVLFRGDSTVANILRFTRVPVSTELLASLMRGLPPQIDRLGQPTVREEEAGWRWVAALRGGGLLTVIFQKGSLAPVSVAISGSREIGDIDARFADYEEVDGVWTAHRIEANLPGGGEVELKYSRIWRDVGLTDDAFTIEAPRGVRVVDMDTVGAAGM